MLIENIYVYMYMHVSSYIKCYRFYRVLNFFKTYLYIGSILKLALTFILIKNIYE